MFHLHCPKVVRGLPARLIQQAMPSLPPWHLLSDMQVAPLSALLAQFSTFSQFLHAALSRLREQGVVLEGLPTNTVDFIKKFKRPNTRTESSEEAQREVAE